MRRPGVLALAAIVLAACGGDDVDNGAAQDLPDLTLPALEATAAPLALADLPGPAVINLWATWCAPCRRELPAFQEVSAERPDVAFVGVDIGEDPANAQAFLDDLGVDFPQYVDEDGELTDALGTAALPVTLVVDTAGQVATTHLGPMSADELHAAIENVTG